MSIDEIEGYPLSAEQRRLWAVGGASGTQRVRAEVSIEGPLRVDALRRAVADTCQRFEILRTRLVRLPGMSMPLQAVADAAVTVLDGDLPPEAATDGMPRFALRSEAPERHRKRPG